MASRPPFQATRIPHAVNCRTCYVAKLKKAPRGPPHDSPPELTIGQVFSMDIGFIRGQSNRLSTVLACTEKATPKVIESRQG